MLWTPGNDFGWSVDNFGATYTDAGLGLNSPGNASAHVKGANTNMLNGIAEDCYGIAICFLGGNSSTVARRGLVDLLVDPAAGVGIAGSSWSVAIANLAANSPCFGTAGAFGYWYYFPLFLKAGTAIGTAYQSAVANSAFFRVAVRIHGKPTRPDLVKVGTKVQTLGAITATTSGTTVVPGTTAMGSYSATLGTLNLDSWWWQVGVLSGDTTMTAGGYLFDVAVNATNKIITAQNIPYRVVGAAEQAAKGAMGGQPPIKFISAGQDVYVRGACGVTPDSTMSAVAYAMAG